MEAAIFTDTEPDTSVDMDESLKDFGQKQKSTLIKSVFNITLQNCEQNQSGSASSKRHDSAEYRDHENKLQTEMSEWKHLWKDAKQQLKALKDDKKTVDISMLPAHKRAYLEQAPNLQKFIRDSLEFREAANIFRLLDVQEILDMQENLVDICDHNLEVVKENKIKELLADVPKEALPKTN